MRILPNLFLLPSSKDDLPVQFHAEIDDLIKAHNGETSADAKGATNVGLKRIYYNNYACM